VKLKIGLSLLGSLAVVVALGLTVKTKTQWERNNRIQQAFPPPVNLALDNSEKFYLYSLQQERLTDADLKTMPNFYGYPIAGQVCVRPKPERADLMAALRGDLGKRTDCSCFAPAYGVRVVRRHKKVDLMISFACEQMEVWDDRGMHRISVSAKAQEVFNHILAEYDVPLPGH